MFCQPLFLQNALSMKAKEKALGLLFLNEYNPLAGYIIQNDNNNTNSNLNQVAIPIYAVNKQPNYSRLQQTRTDTAGNKLC